MKFVGACEYDGSNFSGFQSQKNARSVQGALEKAISSVGRLTNKINYSGRTDAGVHSLGQVFDFESVDSRTIDQWLRGINSALPESISVTSLQEAPKDFHSRFDAIKRTYAYIIYAGPTRPIFLKDYVFWEKNKVRRIKNFFIKTYFLQAAFQQFALHLMLHLFHKHYPPQPIMKPNFVQRVLVL